MSTDALDAHLVATWDDRRLSRAERRSLADLVAGASRPDDARNLVRQRAFALASGFMAEAGGPEVLAWLDEVVRAIWPSPSPPPGDAPASEALFSPDGDIALRLAHLFDAAAERVDVCVFTITDDRVARAMGRAFERGVKIRLLTDDEKAEDLGSDIGRLAGLGMPVRIDRTEHHMHHKFAIFDGARLVTGSYNWTRSANEHNFENVVLLGDQELLRAFSAEFERLWDRGTPY